MENIKIGRSRIKTFLIILASIGFVIGSVWIIRNNDFDLFDKIIAGIGVLFFGAAIPLGIKKLITNEDAIEINDNHLVIEPYSNKKIVLPWSKILGFEEIRISGTKIIIIEVSNPLDWINNERNAIKKKLMQFNNSNYNSPFNITSAGLNVSHKKLLKLLNEFHKKHKL